MAYILMILVLITSVVGTMAIYKCKVKEDKQVGKALQFYYDKLTSLGGLGISANQNSNSNAPAGGNTNIATAIPVNNQPSYQP